MNPQGSGVINTAYLDSLDKQVDSISSCSELQQFAASSLASLQAQLTAINAQIAALAPIQALLNPPTSPGEAISWIGNYIEHVLTPMYQPSVTSAEQLAALTSRIASLSQKIVSKATSFSQCTVTV